ncbi:hypothetical protein H8B09_09840 [Paenibacillus sp. PR3]|uniref:Uncharacterized protein n=1 Tax=Paenibacillus terricola TaxID=2763503 RepID=A0ABR8MSW6_9BACL|nr:hypothetical protein [Paenibacillus terricola]MBD3919055.1 hypothetical protein [Paenibacillus terricola]
MYTLLAILGIAACVYGAVSSTIIVRKQKAHVLDKKLSLKTVKHPVSANPIFIYYVIAPVLAIVIAMVLIYLTQS